MMTCINVAEFVPISWLEKDHSMIETRRLKNGVIFIQTILSFVLSRKLIFIRLSSNHYMRYLGERNKNYISKKYLNILSSTVLLKD